MAKLDTRTLKSILQAERADALGSSKSTELTKQREQAMRYYMGDMERDMPAIEGRSTAVSSDVSDTVEGLLPNLMDIFCASDDVVRFDPVGPEDVEPAQQETDYVNYVFMQLNQGFMVLYSMFKDALLSKTGVAKIWWDTKEVEDRDTYYDQPDDVFALVANDPNVEIIEHTEKEGQPELDPETGEMEPTKFHDFTIKLIKDESQCCVEPVPPEEFGIARDARMDLQQARYLFHETTTETQDSLIKQGYDKLLIEKLPSYSDPSNAGQQERYARDTVDETSEPGGDIDINKAMRRICATEHYIMMDYEGTGKARRYMVKTGGHGESIEILTRDGKPAIDEVDWWPFAAVTPIPQTHRFFGRSIADVVMDLQRINTALTRALLDNAYLATNVRTEVPESAATTETFDDLINSRPGGIVRTKKAGELREIVHPDVGGTVYPALQYFDAKREWRTGVSRQGQGLDADALSNQTATAVQQLYNASQARMKLIAKIFAETGVADLFWLIHSTIRKYGDKPATVRLRNTWVTIDPRNWKSRKDMTVDVGLGRGGKAEETQAVMGLIGLQKAALEGGLTMLVSPRQLFNSAADYCKIVGKKDVDRYFTDPGDEAEMPEAQPDPAIVKAQMDGQLKAQEMQMKAELDQRQMAMKAEIEKVQAEADVATQQLKTQSEIALAERKFELERELKIIEAQIKVQDQQNALTMQERKADADERIANKKLRFEVNAKKVMREDQLNDDGNIIISPEMQAMMDALVEQQKKLEKLLKAPKKTTVKRDPKTKRVLEAETTIVDA